MGTCKVSIFAVFFLFSMVLLAYHYVTVAKGVPVGERRLPYWMDIVLIDLFLFCIELLCCDSKKKKKEKEEEDFRVEARVLWLVGFWRVSSLRLYRTSEL